MAADPYDDWKAAGRPGDYQTWLKQSGRTAPAGSTAAGSLAGVTGSKGQPDPSRATTTTRSAGCVQPNTQLTSPGAVLNPNSACPGGTTWSSIQKLCCPPGAASTATMPSFSMPSTGGFPGMGAGAGAGAAPWNPSALQRPNLTPINPQAAYDPEIANQLARQRANTADLKAGTGFAEDVAVGAERDQQAAQMREAEQAAAQAGIPFDKARFLMEAQRGQASRRAQSTLNREQQVGAAIGAESGVAQAQAGERTDRLGIDLKRDMGENELALDRYGRDIQKYGIDAQAATAANNALMGFYGQLTSGMFGMMGSAMSMGGNSNSQSYSYGNY